MLMLFHYIRIYKPHKAYLITSPITRNEQKIYFIMVTFIDIFCTFVKRHHHIYRWFDVLLEKNPMYHFFVSADVHISRYDQAIFGTAQFGQDIYINVVDNKRWKT